MGLVVACWVEGELAQELAAAPHDPEPIRQQRVQLFQSLPESVRQQTIDSLFADLQPIPLRFEADRNPEG